MHSFFFTPGVIFGLAEILADRMRGRNGGRLWMGAHLRHGDCKPGVGLSLLFL